MSFGCPLDELKAHCSPDPLAVAGRRDGNKGREAKERGEEGGKEWGEREGREEEEKLVRGVFHKSATMLSVQELDTVTYAVVQM